VDTGHKFKWRGIICHIPRMIIKGEEIQVISCDVILTIVFIVHKSTSFLTLLYRSITINPGLGNTHCNITWDVTFSTFRNDIAVIH